MRDIFDEAADQVVIEHSRTSEAQRARMADIYRRMVGGEIEAAAHEIDIQAERLNAAMRTGEAQTVQYVVQSLIDMSARLKAVEAKLST